MLFNDKYRWNSRLEGTPAEAEAWLQAALADGWRQLDHHEYINDNPYYGGRGPIHRDWVLIRSVPASAIPSDLQSRLYPVEISTQYPVPAPFIYLRVATHDARGDRHSNTFGQVSGWVPVYGGGQAARSLCCADIHLPDPYSWDGVLTLLAGYDDWKRELEDRSEREERERVEARDRYETIAHAAQDKADPRRPPEAFLPYVTACCHYWKHAASLEAINQGAYYQNSFRQLTGRDFDPLADILTLSEVQALPEPRPLTTAEIAERDRPTLYECMECGFQTEKSHLIDAGGMGCVRCNH